MSLANSTFESAGTAPGLAADWTSSFISSEEEWADWDQNPGDGFPRAQEGFEAGWTGVDDQTFQGAFQGAPTDQESAVFNSGLVATAFDNFEREWPAPFHTGLIATLTPSEVASFDGADQENFETGWGTSAWTMPATTTAVFGVLNYDSLEAGWGNDAFSDSIATFTPVAALFGLTSPTAADGFENVAPPEAFYVNPSTETMTLVTAPSALTFTPNDPVMVENEGGELPDPLESETTYYLWSINNSTGAFKLKFDAGSSGITFDITDGGTGTQYLLRDPAQWWTRILSV